MVLAESGPALLALALRAGEAISLLDPIEGPSMATLEEIIGRFRKAVGEDSGLGSRVKFDLKGDGVVLIDGAQVSNEDAPADLTMTLSLSALEAMGEKRLDPMMAFMTGRLKVSDMNLAMQLQPKMQALFNRAR